MDIQHIATSRDDSIENPSSMIVCGSAITGCCNLDHSDRADSGGAGSTDDID
jgi:hypothetical protein